MHVLATAGHVDHGKSTLVRALTGTDPDRLAEERRRGLTIDLGFAAGTTPAGAEFALVDVPGHVRYLPNMLAGVGAVAACLFVVDAGEGWKPQSEEHLRILELLGVQHGLLAVTKAGRAGAEACAVTAGEVRARVAGTFLAAAEVAVVDAVDGTGMGELRLALDHLLRRLDPPHDGDRPRLWVDRCFTRPGAGTVVTGTLAGGSLAVGDLLVVHTPTGERPTRVRGLQSHGEHHERLPPGRRVAVNLADLDRASVRRGDALTRPGQWHRSEIADAELLVLAGLDHPVSRKGAYRLHVGSAEAGVQLRVLHTGTIEPGGAAAVRLHLDRPLPLVGGDRFVLRESGRGETVGGGEILDVAPALTARLARPDRSVARMVAERGWVSVDELERFTGVRRPADAGRWVVDPMVLSAAEDRLKDALDAAGPLGLDVALLDERERTVLDRLVASGDAGVRGSRATRAGTTDPLGDHPWLAALARQPFQPPTAQEAGVDLATAREMERRGLVLAHRGLHFPPDVAGLAVPVVRSLLEANPDGFTVSQLREALRSTRKWVVPLVEVLDAAGVTRRRGDLRIAGPRAAGPGAGG